MLLSEMTDEQVLVLFSAAGPILKIPEAAQNSLSEVLKCFQKFRLACESKLVMELNKTKAKAASLTTFFNSRMLCALRLIGKLA